MDLRPNAEVVLARVLSLALLVGACSGPAEEPAEGPAAGIVLVVVDTLRADHLGTYGYDRDTSPGIDRLAAEGAVFEAAIAQASFSGPSFATIMTGMLPQEHGMRDHPEVLAGKHDTLAEAAARGGLRTAGFVAHPFLAERWNFSQGFDLYRAVPAPDDSPVPGGPIDEVVDEAVAWLGTLAEDQPFLLFVQVMEPHMPYDPPAPFSTRFGEPRPDYELMEWVMEHPGQHAPIMFGFRENGYTDADLERTVELYDGVVAHVDSELERLWQKLGEIGRLDSTAVAVTSDHGEMLGEHDLYFHHDMSLYDPVVRVPLVLRYPPAVDAGRRVPSQVRLQDVASTLLDLVGVDGPQGATGRSLAPLLAGGGRDLVAFAENQALQEERAGQPHYRVTVPGIEGKWRMVRTADAKLIMIPTPDGIVEELYDLAADPAETTNVIDERPELAERLRHLLGQQLAADPGLTGGDAGEGEQMDDETLEELKALGYIG